MYWLLNQKEKGRQKDAEEFKEEDFSCESELQTNSGGVLHLKNLMGFNKSAQFTGGGKKKIKKNNQTTHFPASFPRQNTSESLKVKPISFWFMHCKRASSEVRTCWQILLMMMHKPERKSSSLFQPSADSAINYNIKDSLPPHKQAVPTACDGGEVSSLETHFQCKTTLENSKESSTVRNAKLMLWDEKKKKKKNK